MTPYLSRAEAISIGVSGLAEYSRRSTQSWEGLAAAVVDALHALGALPLDTTTDPRSAE